MSFIVKTTILGPKVDTIAKLKEKLAVKERVDELLREQMVIHSFWNHPNRLAKIKD